MKEDQKMLTRALLLKKEEKYWDCIKLLEHSIRTARNRTMEDEFYRVLGDCFFKIEKYKKARAFYEKILRIGTSKYQLVNRYLSIGKTYLDEFEQTGDTNSALVGWIYITRGIAIKKIAEAKGIKMPSVSKSFFDNRFAVLGKMRAGKKKFLLNQKIIRQYQNFFENFEDAWINNEKIELIKSENGSISQYSIPTHQKQRETHLHLWWLSRKTTEVQNELLKRLVKMYKKGDLEEEHLLSDS